MFLRSIKRFRSPFKALYEEAGLAPALRRGITMVILGNICGNLWFSITNGSALTGFARELGAGDLVFGILTGIPMAATLMQFPAALMVSRTQKRKQYMLTFGVLARALWIVVGLVPYFLPVQPVWLRLWSVIFLVGVSSASGSFINVCFMPWMADLVPIGIRGRWISLRDGIISVANVLIGLLTATLLDRVPGFDGYALVFILGGTLGVIDMLCFLPVPELRRETPVKTSFAAVARQIFHDRPFFRFLLFWTAWCFTANLSGPYLARYALGELGLSFTQVTLFGQITSAAVTVLVISLWGKLLDRYGTKPVLWVSCVVASLTPGFFLFGVPGSVVPLLLHYAIGAAFWSASNLAATNQLLSSSPDDQRPSYVAFFSCFTNLLGAFLGVLAGGALLELIQSAADRFDATLGFVPDRYKIVIALSVVARLGITLWFVPRLHNDRDGTVSSMLGDLRAHFKMKR